MALVKPVIFQVVGYQNSGKTTFLLKLIQTLTTHGLKTVTIKHHGHGGKPDVVLQKDSSRHLEAGAFASLVEGDGRLVLQVEESEWSLEEQLRLMEHFQPDVILIEGHKQKHYPKLLLLKDQADISLLSKVENVKAIIYWDKNFDAKTLAQFDIPSYPIESEKVVIEISKLILKSL
jgi:molybdopterin-guanine dinucleotide biosynthesis adapter protein